MAPEAGTTTPDGNGPQHASSPRRIARVVLAAVALAVVVTCRLLPLAGFSRPAGGPARGEATPATTAPVPPPAHAVPSKPTAGEEPQVPAAPACTQVTITAVGDLLMHLPLVRAAATADSHDFTPLLAPVADRLAAADLTIANLETTFGGPERGWSGYPRFNTPDTLADAVRDAGVDVLTTANNHALDTGGAGLTRTLDVIRSRGLAAAGTRAAADEPGVALVEAGGLKVAVLAYTYGTNGIPVPEPYMINLIDRERMAADVAAARAAGADLVVVAPHWGLEYQRQPTEEQRELARYLAGLGVDAIFGAHPHVVQPVELLAPARPGGRPVPVFYSMGNFASNQRDRYTDWGIIASVTFTVARWEQDDRAQIDLTEVAHQPVWVHRYTDAATGRPRYRVVSVDGEAAHADPLLSEADLRRLDAVRGEARELPGGPVLYAGDAAADPAGSVNRRNVSTSDSAASTASCQNSGRVRSASR